MVDWVINTSLLPPSYFWSHLITWWITLLSFYSILLVDVMLENVTVSCDHPRPSTISHNFLPPLTTSLYFTTTTHNHSRPTMIHSPLPTSNDSSATTLLKITASELYFCHHYTTHPAEFQWQSKFTRHYPPNTKKFSFSEK